MEFLRRKWARELDYALRKDLWSFGDDRIAVRFQYECHNASGQWFRSYGNELWEFDADGYMKRREASINDLPIAEVDRRIPWAYKRRAMDALKMTASGWTPPPREPGQPWRPPRRSP